VDVRACIHASMSACTQVPCRCAQAYACNRCGHSQPERGYGPVVRGTPSIEATAARRGSRHSGRWPLEHGSNCSCEHLPHHPSTAPGSTRLFMDVSPVWRLRTPRLRQASASSAARGGEVGHGTRVRGWSAATRTGWCCMAGAAWLALHGWRCMAGAAWLVR